MQTGKLRSSGGTLLRRYAPPSYALPNSLAAKLPTQLNLNLFGSSGGTLLRRYAPPEVRSPKLRSQLNLNLNLFWGMQTEFRRFRGDASSACISPSRELIGRWELLPKV